MKAGLIAEMRRRRVFRTLALYIVAAWVLMQVADVVFPALGIPETAIRYLLLATVVGFPVALVFGWLFDITPDGIHRTSPATAGETNTVEPLQRSDYLILSALALVLGLIIYGTIDTVVELPADPQLQTAAERAPRGEGPPMVGVLPFTFRGTGDDAEFFASGVHDDLLTQMSQLSGLRVISRTSVLEYAGTTKNIIDIGRELRADAILEGGVQVAGGQIRINAQLIDARTDEHLWAETFDRELTTANIFAVQAEIARSIASQLQATLSAQEATALKLVPTSNMAAYRAYHEGIRIYENAHLHENRDAGLAAFEKAIELDPTFTRAMSEFVGLLSLKNFRINDPEDIAEIEKMLERIDSIAPNSVDHLMAQGFYAYYIVRDYDLARQLIGAARTRAPSDTRLVSIESYIARRMGDLEAWVDAARESWKLEPRNQRWAGYLTYRLMIMHRYSEALEVASSVENPVFELALLHEELQLATHHDPVRYRDKVRALIERFNVKDDSDVVFTLLEANVLARDYAEAETVIAGIPELPLEPDYSGTRYPARRSAKLFLGINTGDRELLASTLAQVNHITGLDDDPLGERRAKLNPTFLLGLAVASGSPEVLREALDVYEGELQDDLALALGGRQEYCAAFAQLEEAARTVDCLRQATTQPSDVRPYMEPLYPVYDLVRDTPEFRQLLSDLAGDGYLDKSYLKAQ